MPMEHKAYAFDWFRFDCDLYPVLFYALSNNITGELESFIDRHHAELSNPYEGDPLSAEWREMLENRDPHEYGDFALTRYYSPTDCAGIGYEWARLSEELPGPAAKAMLGVTLGPAEQVFDPGRYGSYFQTPQRARESLATLRPHRRQEVAKYLELLERCVAKRLGVYVTF